MAKWKCNNEECLNTWREKEPICCPQCGSKDFEEVKNSNIVNFKKTSIILGLILLTLLIVILSMKFCASGNVEVDVNFDKTMGTIQVQLDLPANYEVKEFEIELLRSGSVYEKVEGAKSYTFENLNPGSYYINVKYIGKKVLPVINIINKGPFEILEAIESVKININNCFPVPDYKTKKYTVSIKITPDSLQSICEFSVDSGKIYQSENIFNLDPGKYYCVARMKGDKSNNDIYELNLNEIVNIPTQSIIQELLDKVSGGDMNAYEKLNTLFNNTGIIKITGAGDINTLYNLMNDCNLGNRYQINNMQINNNQITLNVTKK